jgi:hypothetical protein
MSAIDSILDAAVGADSSTLAVRKFLFHAMLSGQAVPARTVALSTDLDEPKVRDIIDQLVKAGVATVTNDGQGDLLVDGAEGVTTRTTRHSLLIDGLPLHTWCAFDIVGIPAALEIGATGSTDCPTCGRAIELSMVDGEVADHGVVGWWPATTGGPVIEAFCPSASLFCSSEHLDQWRVAQGASGSVKSVADLEALGRSTWSNLVR